MADYITYDQITDSVISVFGASILNAKIGLSTEALNDLAKRQGVDSGSISTDDDDTGKAHRIVQDWCIYWVCEMICLDYMGKNDDPMVDDKYNRKFEVYHALRVEAGKSINREVLLGVDDEARERVGLGSGIIFRG